MRGMEADKQTAIQRELCSHSRHSKESKTKTEHKTEKEQGAETECKKNKGREYLTPRVPPTAAHTEDTEIPEEQKDHKTQKEHETEQIVIKLVL